MAVEVAAPALGGDERQRRSGRRGVPLRGRRGSWTTLSESVPSCPSLTGRDGRSRGPPATLRRRLRRGGGRGRACGRCRGRGGAAGPRRAGGRRRRGGCGRGRGGAGAAGGGGAAHRGGLRSGGGRGGGRGAGVAATTAVFAGTAVAAPLSALFAEVFGFPLTLASAREATEAIASRSSLSASWRALATSPMRFWARSARATSFSWADRLFPTRRSSASILSFSFATSMSSRSTGTPATQPARVHANVGPARAAAPLKRGFPLPGGATSIYDGPVTLDGMTGSQHHPGGGRRPGHPTPLSSSEAPSQKARTCERSGPRAAGTATDVARPATPGTLVLLGELRGAGEVAPTAPRVRYPRGTAGNHTFKIRVNRQPNPSC